MKKILLFVLCMFLLTGCTSSKKENNNNSSSLNTISYTTIKTPLTQSVIGDTEADYPIFIYQLNKQLKSAIIQVWKKEDKWKSIITSYEDNIYPDGQIAIILGDKSYDIYLIHSKTENEIINYNFSQHYLDSSLNNKELMFANTLDNTKINTAKEIVLFSSLEYNNDKAPDLLEYLDFRNVDCNYGIVVTITFYDTEKAPRS